MVAIADKFGKASISTGYATATTVKVARTAGESVLSTYDLSKFAPDTPVFFVTYKKTTDPTTNVVSITSQTSWKALVNPDNNTLTNLTLAPGYTDIGNDIGDFVECIPTSFWGNSLVEGLFVSMNPDGTLKTSAVNTALGITGVTPPDWNVLPVIPTMVSSDGQRQHKLRYTGVDYRPSINEGFKLRIPRTGTTPTTSMAFNAASNQYASKTGAVGTGQTSTITWEGWVTPDTYRTDNSNLFSTRNSAGTDGYRVLMQPNGIISIYAYNGGSWRGMKTFQSLPLMKATHVAVTWDMAGFTAATCKVTFDGVDIPVGFEWSGTPTSFAPTSIIRLASDSQFANEGFTGKLANVRLWSTIRTLAQIRDNMNQEVPASTTGLIGHWKGNGSWNDSSTNANHLTAANGAVNNFATHPFSATEYAIATKVEYTGGNTDVTVFTGSGCLPNETLGATSYSTARTPYGFPADRTLWTVRALLRTSKQVASPATGTVYEVEGLRLSYPIGRWVPGLSLHVQDERTTAGNSETWYGIGDTATSDPLTTPMLRGNVHDTDGSGGYLQIHQVDQRSTDAVSVTTQSTKYITMKTGYGGQAGLTFRGDRVDCTHTIECAYL